MTAAPSVARSSLTMFGGSVASRVLGTVRAGLITSIIGARLAGDAFSLANTLPNVLYMLAAGGILNAVLIPSLTRAMRLPDGGQQFTDRVITIALVGMTALTVLVTAGAGLFVQLLASTSAPSMKRLALAFSLITLPQIFFYGLFALLGQILNARGRFGAFAWAPFMANIVAVTGLVLFIILFPAPHQVDQTGQPLPRAPEQWTGPMIWLFAGSATLSVVVQSLWLVPALRRSGFQYRPRWGIRGAGLGGVSRLAMWAFVGLVVSQLGFFITQGTLNHAVSEAPRGVPVGGPAVSGIAFTIFMLPHAFVTVSIITALFPRLSAAAARGDAGHMHGDFRTGLIMPLVVNVAVMAFVMVEAEPIVALLNPGLSQDSVRDSAVVLVIMILGIIPFGIDLLCYRTLFALEAGQPTFIMQIMLTGTSVVAMLVTFVVAPQWAVAVMAFGQTVGNIISCAYGLRCVRTRIGPIGGAAVIDAAARVGVAATVAGVMAWGTHSVLAPIRTYAAEGEGTTVVGRMIANALEIGLVGVVFVAIYVGIAHLLHVKEVREAAEMVRDRVSDTGMA
ncbi:murein biosynthesis integral membrane protein MurJ [Monashia sp. NPDC004114]